LARILIVDDNLMIRTLLRDILGSGDHEIVGEAHDGVQAEARVRQLLPDLVTLDLVMPVRGGLDSLPYLLDVDPSLPVVVCSASLDQTRVLAALQRGAMGFIVKPFDRDSVLASVDEVLARASRRKPGTDPGSRLRPARTAPPGDVHNEQRDFTRVGNALPIRVIPDGGRPLITVTIDLSGGGLLLSRGQLAIGTGVDFCLELGPGEVPINGRARAVRIDAEGRPALAFEHVSVDDHERLIAYLHDEASPSRVVHAVAT
jgi:two-component system chemotaxis response regulator CheY